MTELILREASVGDLEAIMEMEEDGFEVENHEYREVYRRQIEMFPGGSLIGEIEGQPIGCIFMEIWHPRELLFEDDFSLHRNDRHRADGSWLYISSFTVKPEFRGRGLGRQLFERSVNLTLGDHSQVTKVLLLVNCSWSHARSIYRQTGFTERRIFSGIFNAKDDGILMEKDLLF